MAAVVNNASEPLGEGAVERNIVDIIVDVDSDGGWWRSFCSFG